MGWLSDLCLTYDIYNELAGKDNGEEMLLPIAHSTQNAQIEVILSEEGELLDALKIEKADAETIIPVTEDSAARSSGIAPHPLCDKLIYIAGDFSEYVADIKGKGYQEYYEAYIQQLRAWIDSPYANEKVHAIYQYLSQGTLIKDLIKKEILMLDGELLDEKQKIAQIDQKDCFVRFRVEKDRGPKETAVWKDVDTYRSFQQYYLNSFSEQTLCYVSGKECYCSDKHPSKVRHPADKAKLISANDASGFTFRGRFNDKEEANAISYEVSQKAHNALKWLIQKQGKRVNEMVMVVWGNRCVEVPIPGTSTRSLIEDFSVDEETENDQTTNDITVEIHGTTDAKGLYADQIKRAIFISHKEIGDDENVTIMTLEAATVGRLSITYYKQLAGSKYKSNILFWHESCCYYDSFRKMAGAPGIFEIIDAAYGTEQNGMLKTRDNVKQTMVSRLLPCIVDRKKIPFDVIRQIAAKASNPVAYGKSNRRKIQNVAFAVIRKYYNDRNINQEKEDYTMALQEERSDRDYLFGRLLAVAHAAESRALRLGNDMRDTSAERYMNAFRSHPYTTWGIIRDKLNPYYTKLRKRSGGALFYEKEIQSIMDQFQLDGEGRNEFEHNEALSPTYLLGYYAELGKIYSGTNNQDAEAGEKENVDE